MAEKLYEAIGKQRLVEFHYTDKTKGKEDTRVIEPYLLGINKHGNLFISGYFLASPPQVESGMKNGHKNYLIDNIAPDSLTILTKKFDRLKVESFDKIYKTKETLILAVAYFPEIIISYL
jgi:hypothetical protein